MKRNPCKKCGSHPRKRTTRDGKWVSVADLSEIYAPYIRVVYVIRTSGYVNVSTAANIGGEQVMKTLIYVPR